jgi:hypothetical protein
VSVPILATCLSSSSVYPYRLRSNLQAAGQLLEQCGHSHRLIASGCCTRPHPDSLLFCCCCLAMTLQGLAITPPAPWRRTCCQTWCWISGVLSLCGRRPASGAGNQVGALSTRSKQNACTKVRPHAACQCGGVSLLSDLSEAATTPEAWRLGCHMQHLCTQVLFAAAARCLCSAQVPW